MRGYDQWKTASPYDEPEYCTICGQMDTRCKCPACPTCDIIGRVECINEHGIKPTHTVWYSIEMLCENLGRTTLRQLYRAVYRYGDWGLSIGAIWGDPEFAKWIWCDNLPDQTPREVRPNGLAISGIVEGHDVEIPPNCITTPFGIDTFWDRAQEVSDSLEDALAEINAQQEK